MLDSILFPPEYDLKIETISLEQQVIVIVVSSSNPEGICPCCHRTFHRVHSCYQRQPADLPIAAHLVRLLIKVRRFFGLNSDCERRIFAFLMPALLEPYARCTNRLMVHRRHVALALGGEAGARLRRTQGIAVSPDTLLRIIRYADETEVRTPRVLGLDDWAQKKGHSYGTILVD